MRWYGSKNVVLFKKEQEAQDFIWGDNDNFETLGGDVFKYLPTNKYFEIVYEDGNQIELQELNTEL